MKRNIVWTLFFVVMLSLSLAAVAKDKEDNDRLHLLTRQGRRNVGIQRNRNDDPSRPYGFPQAHCPMHPWGATPLTAMAMCRGERTASLGGMILKATITGDRYGES